MSTQCSRSEAEATRLDARQRLVELLRQRGRLASASAEDDRIAAELLDVESELASAWRELGDCDA